MFYENITNEQVTALNKLLKLLRYLNVCGVLELEVKSNWAKYPNQESWSYTVKALKYYPDKQFLPAEKFENQFNSLLLQIGRLL